MDNNSYEETLKYYDDLVKNYTKSYDETFKYYDDLRKKNAKIHKDVINNDRYDENGDYLTIEEKKEFDKQFYADKT